MQEGNRRIQGKPEDLGKPTEASLDWKNAHLSAETENQTQDSLVQSKGNYTTLN